MSHEVETLAFTGQTPWHKLGTRVEGLMTATEAIQKGGLDWTVELRDIYLEGEVKIPDRRAVVRDTDQRVYTVVSQWYEPIQNSECFQFFDSVVGSREAKYEVVGSLRNGAHIFLLAKLNESMGVRGEQIDKCLVLVNGHDGGTALQMFFTPVRVVCANTLAMALSKAADRFYARHVSGVTRKMEEARDILGLANSWYSTWIENAERLATHALPSAEMPLLLKAALGLPVEMDFSTASASARNQMQEVEALMETGRGLDNPAIRGTRWAAYNAVAEYVDHHREYRGEEHDRQVRGAMFGVGSQIKRRAWDYLVAAQ